MFLFKTIDGWIDQITMYRLMLYYLGGLLLVSFFFSTVNILHYRPIWIIIEAGVLLFSCWIINKIFAFVFSSPTNPESSLITALILTLIITPFQAPGDSGLWFAFLLAASGLAIGSKYLLTIHNKHIFNPAALAVFFTALGAGQTAGWWVSSGVLLPFVLFGGMLIARKLRLFKMVSVFFAVSLFATTLLSFSSNGSLAASLITSLSQSPLFFLGFVMLTEPQTLPPKLSSRAWYAAIVGALLPPQVHFFGYYTSPELALLIGNIFSFIVSPKQKLFPVLQQKVQLAPDIFEFVFHPEEKVRYSAGQYMEWTLPHQNTDTRGARRYFTLASSPTEPELRLGLKFYHPSSSFKQALLESNQKTKISAGGLSGEFLLPKDKEKKLCFIAGGIGITPFRSMMKYLLDVNQPRDIIVLYAAQNSDALVYSEIFEQARTKLGIETAYFISNTDENPRNFRNPYFISGLITPETIRRVVPDFLDRSFYLSGTHAMVLAMRKNLLMLGVPRRQIKEDFFPGYV
ncbi:MAG TPA: oxidoreductase [Candidatus Paceibacterota bacterium]|nr:oxidoreductase [Candidatus Paceibacterota bacterium]